MEANVISVIVRSKNKADTIGRTFDSIRRQTIPSEIVVVDSGSTDATLDIARRYADVIVEIPGDEFTFGRSLNIGAAAATSDLHAAVSAHVALPNDGWLARAAHHLRRKGVAGTSGSLDRPDGRILLEPFEQGLDDWQPNWGFTNTAAAWRAETWRDQPFDEAMSACEDKEWARRVLRAGWRLVLDPQLVVRGVHRRRAGLRDLLRRCTAESYELVLRTDMPPTSARDAVARWWGDVLRDEQTPPVFQRLSYFRATEIAGSYLGSRQAKRQAARASRQ
jgi:glycosyltransferase involved in cell wall biosynthesis